MDRYLLWKKEHGVVLQKREGMIHQIIRLILLFSFIGGILTANLSGQEQISQIGVLNDYFMERFEYHTVHGENLFFYILGERVPMLVLLFLLAFSSLGVVSGMFFLGWQVFSVGFMMAAAIAKYGVRGILLAVGAIFPQYLVYFPIYIIFCYIAQDLRKSRYKSSRDGMTSREQLRNWGAAVVLFGILFLFYLAGICLESYVNPMILKKIMRFL